MREATRQTPIMTKEEEKKNQVTFPQSLNLWDSKRVPFPPGTNRCQESKSTQL